MGHEDDTGDRQLPGALGVSDGGTPPGHCGDLGPRQWVSPREAVSLLTGEGPRPEPVVLAADDLEGAGTLLAQLRVAGLGDAVTCVVLSRAAVLQTVQTLRQLQKAIDNIPAPIFCKDADGVYGACNKAFEDFVGVAREEIIGRTVHDLWPPELAAIYAEADRALFEAGGCQIYDAQVKYADGSVHDVTFYKGVFIDDHGDTEGLSGAILDITERRALEAQLQRLADTDPLTGVANRALFSRQLHEAATGNRGDRRVAVLLVDLDDFKLVNDTLGHDVGDKLLVVVTRLLRQCVRTTDTVARLGGDEFAVLLEGVPESDVDALVKRILGRLGEPLVVDGHPLAIGASIGVAYAQFGERGTDLLHNADVAMYAAKEHGKGRCAYYRPGMRTRALERAALLDGLRRSLARRELFLEFQPVVRLPDGHLVAFEALVRWRHPDRGLVPPEEFIPTAERGGLMVPLGRWVLHEACRQASIWPDREGLDAPLAVHVNVSTHQLREPQFLPEIQAVLDDTGLLPARLVLEVTETSVTDEAVCEALRPIRDLGVRVAFDDFGTGQSSLAVLATCPVDILKVDKLFVDRINGPSRQADIARAMAELADRLGLIAIVEGVENAAQARRLYELGYRQAQGFHFAPPLPATDMNLFLTDPTTRTATGG